MAANWDSDVGYAWWLMESYWIALAERYQKTLVPLLAYPSISKIPHGIQQSPITVRQVNFAKLGWRWLLPQISFLLSQKVRVMYLTDKPVFHWTYLLFRLMGVRRIVVHDHTPGLRTKPQGLRRGLKSLLCRTPGISANVCIGATEFVRNRFVDVGCVPATKCFTVANGIPVELPAAASAHEAFGIPRDKKLIFTAARAHLYKGGMFALDVLTQVARSTGLDGWHYVYFGDGPHRTSLIERARELGLENNVSFPGRVEGVVKFFQDGDIAFHPSRGEVGYSLSILEYMLAGLPVVVPDNPSVSGATEHERTGLVYAEDDITDASLALLRYLKHPQEGARMGALGSARVNECFSLNVTHRTLLSVFDGALTGIVRDY
ncbi:glycosyltransferase family 4 protein [Marinobacter sp. SS21]|uniref:glycosyltransferase family 4 protein n=1 Tax=Marinobacter sp. SS21 TaxID=2979460 RepID=UPI00232B3671|nr:glycosyltransferase family 4 protein [Marinobacter sp. SS21]MDC0661941.1 glycosyltransferase family 4 protein [Marinobacter sp. SS21]